MVNEASFSRRRTPASDSTGSRTKAQLGKEAIRCALDGAWEQAVTANQKILEICPTDCEASNRLAKALMELGDYSKARQTLEQLRLHSPANVIARKNLARLDQLQSGTGEARSQPGVTGKSPGMFIAESGKSCTTTLCQLAVPAESAPVSAGDVVLLNARSDGVTVNTRDGRYLGTLQRRLGRRVNKLMAGGNQYEAAVLGVEANGLSVIVREVGQAPALRHVVSFPAQVTEPLLHGPVSEREDHAPAPNDEPDQLPSDLTDSDDAADSAETAVMDMPDDTPVESIGIDDVPTLDTDEDTTDWSPVTLPSEDEEEWE